MKPETSTSVPQGQVTHSINMFAYMETVATTRGDSKLKQLQTIRNFASVRNGRPEVQTADKYKALASRENIHGHRDQMRVLRVQIDATLARLSRLDAPPLKRSALKSMVRAAEFLGTGVLSRMGNNKPDIKGAMQKPFRKDAPKADGKSGTAAALLGEGAIKERRATHILEHGIYLQTRADEQYRYGPGARAEELTTELALLKPHHDALIDATLNVEKVIAELTHARERLAQLQTDDEAGDKAGDVDVDVDVNVNVNVNVNDKLQAIESEFRYLASWINQFEEKQPASVSEGAEPRKTMKPADTGPSKKFPLSNAQNEVSRSSPSIAQSYKAAMHNLDSVLCKIEAEISGTGIYRKALRDKIAAARLRAGHLSPDPEASPNGIEKRLLLAHEIRTLLKNTIGAIRFELENANSNLVKDLHDASENLARAETLVKGAINYVEDAKKLAPRDSVTVNEKISSLNGFITAASVSGLGQEALEMERARLQENLTALFSHLCNQAEPTGDQLTDKAVFDLTYGTIVQVLAGTGRGADPKSAADVLTEILHPEMRLRSLMGSDLGKNTRLVMQALAALPRGTEIVQRIVANDEPIDASRDAAENPRTENTEKEPGAHTQEIQRNARQRNLALHIYLRAGNELERGGRLNDSTKELLHGARAAAKKLYANPRAPLTDAEHVAYAAVRNRLTDTGPDSPMQFVSRQLEHVMDRWVRRAVDRDHRKLGRIGQGSNTGIAKVKNVFPSTGKTPFGSSTIALAESTSPAYSFAPKDTGSRMDEYIKDSSSALRAAAIALVRNGAPLAEIGDTLIGIAAASVAWGKIDEAAKGGHELRPEHCVVGGSLSQVGVLESINTAVLQSFHMSGLNDHDKLSGAVADTVCDTVSAAMATGSPTIEELVDTARQTAYVQVKWQIDDLVIPPDTKTEILRNLDIEGAMTGIGATNAPDDLAAVQNRLVELANEAGMDVQGEQFQRILARVSYPLPPLACQPLRAETLMQSKNILEHRSRSGIKNAETKALLDKAVSETRKLEQLFTTSVPARLDDAEDIYNYLLAKFEQFESPGKLRMTSGGVVGPSTKGISEAVSRIKWIGGLASLAPKLRIEGLWGRNAVLEISLTAIGCEVFLASEKKTSAAVGVGIASGFGISEAKGSLSLDKAIVPERASQKGVRLVVPRSMHNEYNRNDMRAEAKTLLDTLFHWQPPENESGELNGVPGNLAAVLVACPHVSIVVTDKVTDRSLKQESAGMAALTSKGTLSSRGGQSLGGSVGVGGKNTYLNWREVNISNETGFYSVERHNLAHGGQTAVHAGVAPSATIVSIGQDVKNSVSATSSGLSSVRQTKVAGVDVKLRILTIDGKTNSQYTRREKEHATFSSFRQSVEANREAWIQLGVAELFAELGDRNIPVEEKRRLVDRSLDHALRECEKSERTHQGTPILRNQYAESYKLTDSATSQFDEFRAKEALCNARIEGLDKHIRNLKAGASTRDESAISDAKRLLTEATKERIKLISAQNALLREDSSWTPWILDAIERTQKSVQSGVDVFLKIGASDTADAQRPIMSWPNWIGAEESAQQTRPA